MGPLTNTYVFLFFFAFGYLVAGRTAILTLTTRITLVALFGCALWFALSGGSSWHDIIGVATLILNALFVAFGVMDYLAFMKNRSSI